VEFHVSLARRGNLADDIYRQLVQAIGAGLFRPGERLPPTRELASRLSVSRMTVTVAYDRLMGEGLLTSRVGAGTFVSERAARAVIQAEPAQSPLRPRPIWSELPARARPRPCVRSVEFDFRSGVPDASMFPFDAWRRLIGSESRASTPAVGLYGDPAGHHGLREAIARHIGVSRDVRTVAEDVTITNGTQQALDLIARVLLEPGGAVALEHPGYPQAWRLFNALGARVAAVPVDGEGLVVEALPRDIRLVYVTPAHQFPLGVTMSLARRRALLDWARVSDAAIVEDDHDSEFRFDGRPMAPLYNLDSSGRVIYVNSFSKSMLPTLRLAFVVTPPSLSEAMRAAKYVTDWHSPLAAQAALSHFIDEGLFARHLRKMRAVYQARHERIVETVAEQFAEHLEVVPSGAGLHVCALARHASPDELGTVVGRALAMGVEVDELARYALGCRPRAGLVLGYGAIPTDRIDEGLRRLRRCFDD
jgi:GntR family transcriptional regulator/MocR family aminotransferase